jgi:uncharacterized protein with HEPN domain
MQPDERDAGYLWDMLDAARTVRELVHGVRAHEYLRDRKLQLAVERCVEIIGEAARHVSDAFRQAHPDIPWRGIVAQRHVLAHEYGEIKQERMWAVATQRVPELISFLTPLLPPEPPVVED